MGLRTALFLYSNCLFSRICGCRGPIYMHSTPGGPPYGFDAQVNCVQSVCATGGHFASAARLHIVEGVYRVALSKTTTPRPGNSQVGPRLSTYETVPRRCLPLKGQIVLLLDLGDSSAVTFFRGEVFPRKCQKNLGKTAPCIMPPGDFCSGVSNAGEEFEIAAMMIPQMTNKGVNVLCASLLRDAPAGVPIPQLLRLNRRL